jgi:hypothetical protein
MTKQQIKDMPNKELREWIARLNKEGRFKEIMLICKVRLEGK